MSTTTNNSGKNVTAAVTASQISAAASRQLHEVVSNPMYCANQLSKLARKNEYCDGQDIKAVETALRKLTDSGRYAFTRENLIYDSIGRVCRAVAYTRSVYTGDFCFVFGRESDRCNEVSEMYGVQVELVPVRITTENILRVYCSRLKLAELSERNRAAAQKAADREKKAQERAIKLEETAQKRAMKEVQRRLRTGECTLGQAQYQYDCLLAEYRAEKAA